MVSTNDTSMSRAQFFLYIRIIGVKIRRIFRKTRLSCLQKELPLSKDPSRDANLVQKGMIFPQGLAPMLYLYAKYVCVVRLGSNEKICCPIPSKALRMAKHYSR